MGQWQMTYFKILLKANSGHVNQPSLNGREVESKEEDVLEEEY